MLVVVMWKDPIICTRYYGGLRWLVCTYLPTRNIQRPVSRNAMRTPTHMLVEKGDIRLKVLSSEARSLCKMKPSPVCMKGVVISTTCSLTAVRVSGATARSASWWRVWAHRSYARHRDNVRPLNTLRCIDQNHIQYFQMSAIVRCYGCPTWSTGYTAPPICSRGSPLLSNE